MGRVRWRRRLPGCGPSPPLRGGKVRHGESLRSKNRVAQENELLAKLLAYNLTVLIHEMFENGVSPDWLKQNPAARSETLPGKKV